MAQRIRFGPLLLQLIGRALLCRGHSSGTCHTMLLPLERKPADKLARFPESSMLCIEVHANRVLFIEFSRARLSIDQLGALN